MRTLKISYAGARGVIGDTMTPVFAQRYVSSFATYLGGAPVAIARDTRSSSEMLHHAALSALLSCGCDVYDLGICPTPVAQFYIRNHKKIKGGLVITGGHNNADWNGIIPFKNEGTVFDEHQGGEFLEFYHAVTFRTVGWKKIGKQIVVNDHFDLYSNSLISFLNSKTIKEKKLKVVVDPCNGTASPLIESILKKLNCNVIPINNQPNGVFPHDPEPRPRNSKQVSEIIKAVGADIGLCYNSDSTRLSIVTNTGETISEEYTFPLVADHCLSRNPNGTIVTNICTTRTLDAIAARYSAKIIKTPIGQPAIVSALLNHNACLGGEGSGGVAVSSFQPAFDAFLSTVLLIELLAESNKTLSELVDELPRYHLVKKYVWCRPDKQYAAVDAVRKAFIKEKNIDTTDGIRIDWKDGWLHVRSASTEPVVRVISEGVTPEIADGRVDFALHIIYSAI